MVLILRQDTRDSTAQEYAAVSSSLSLAVLGGRSMARRSVRLWHALATVGDGALAPGVGAWAAGLTGWADGAGGLACSTAALPGACTGIRIRILPLSEFPEALHLTMQALSEVSNAIGLHCWRDEALTGAPAFWPLGSTRLLLSLLLLLLMAGCATVAAATPLGWFG